MAVGTYVWYAAGELHSFVIINRSRAQAVMRGPALCEAVHQDSQFEDALQCCCCDAVVAAASFAKCGAQLEGSGYTTSWAGR